MINEFIQFLDIHTANYWLVDQYESDDLALQTTDVENEKIVFYDGLVMEILSSLSDHNSI